MNAQPGSFVNGVPEPLPAGERLIWQGKPDWRSLARHALHADLVAFYFAALAAWHGLEAIGSGEPAAAFTRAGITLALGAASAGLLTGLAWLMARTTIYAVTTRRVVMRIGIALPVTYNVPFAAIAGAALARHADGTGDLALSLTGANKIPYLHLWPHARPWQISRPQPMLRSVPDAVHVAEVLSRAALAAQPGEHAGATTLSVTSSNASGRAPRLVPVERR